MSSREEKDEVAPSLMNVEIIPAKQRRKALRGNVKKIPFTVLASLGVGLSSLPEAARTIVQTMNVGGGETLYRCVFPTGVAGQLAQFKDGSGFLGTIINDGIVGQARWIPVQPSVTTMMTIIPFDPMSLFMAAALAGISTKLDHIDDTNRTILEFLVRDKESRQKGDLGTLNDILNKYKFNWDNEAFRITNLSLVQQINRDAKQNIDFYHGAVCNAATSHALIHFDLRVKQKRDDVIRELAQYQMAIYLFAFSTMLEVMLLKNFTPEHLDAVIDDVEKQSFAYQKFYTEINKAIAELSEGSVNARALEVISQIPKGAGDFLKQTPIISDIPFAAPLGEQLTDTGDSVDASRIQRHRDIMEPLEKNQEAQIQPFIDTIKNVNKLYNMPTEILIDKKNIYFKLPELGN